MNDHEDNNGDGGGMTIKAPSLYKRSTFFRQTRKRGKIFKTVKECYVRDDLGFGTHFVDEEDDDGHKKKSRRRVQDAVVGKPREIESVSHLLSLLVRPKTTTLSLVVCDANVLLHNMDVLEQSVGVMPNLVIPQTALLECRANQVTAYDRTVELLRAVRKDRLVVYMADLHHSSTANDDNDDEAIINDVNDARLRRVARFYGTELSGTNVRVIFLTDDAASRALAQQQDNGIYVAKSVRSYIMELEQQQPPEEAAVSLSDLVAQQQQPPASSKRLNQKKGGKDSDALFEPHLDALTVSRGVQSGKLYRGVLRASSSDTTRAMVTIRRDDERVAVTILGETHRNRAMDGDVVAIAILPVAEWLSDPSIVTATPKQQTVGIANETAEPTHGELHNVPDAVQRNDHDGQEQLLRPTGRVVGIIRRNSSNTYCGSIYSLSSASTNKDGTVWSKERQAIAARHEKESDDDGATCVFFPVDAKIPPILIRTTQRERLVGQRIVVAVDAWPSNSPYPLGHYVRTIGKAGTKDVETQVLLHQHKIPHEPFPAKVLACLPPTDYKIDIENSPGRADLRDLPVLSIDPPGCKDIDDALHCLVLPNGNYQVGVHIADVTHYVNPGTPIDLEAANRSTSTYLVNKRLDMLPGLLTTDLCSLKGNVDRYAFSVIWEVKPGNAEIVNVDFHKSIIHSIAALTYQQAQALIDQPTDDGKDARVGAVKRLAAMARIFRKRRIDAGALTLASPEVKFVLDSESLNPTDVQSYTLFEANAVVEEFMLLANITVAKKILRHYPTLSILRRHPSPSRTMFESLISKARCRGFEIDIEDSKRLADSLDAATIDSDPFFNRLLRILSTRCMSPAQYFCSGEFKPTEWHHYGLAAPVYTHFTSPIRRYADVCVHRLLAAAIGESPLPVHLSSKPYLHDLSANMNRRHRSAQLAGRASVQLHTLIFFSGAGEEEEEEEEDAKEEDAYVLDVETAQGSDPSFTVIVPRYGIEGRVVLSHISPTDPKLVRDATNHKIVYDKDVSIQVFDRVRVKIWVRNLQDHQKELVLNLLEPSFGETGEKNKKQAEKKEAQSPKRKAQGEKRSTKRKKT